MIAISAVTKKITAKKQKFKMANNPPVAIDIMAVTAQMKTFIIVSF